MDEWIDVLDIEGNKTGKTCQKSVVHKKGLCHATVHIWFYTSKGKILLQQRAASKAIYPLLWDVSVAGHVNSGESLLTAAIREVKEEIGITVGENDLKKIGLMKSFQSYKSGIIDNEFHTIFISELKEDIENLILQKEEVEALKTVSILRFEELLENSEHNSHFINSNKEYYISLLKEIKYLIRNKT
ncbi:NUDIX domain-containing protein [Flavobacteriaceae bacterium]|nr:NUDIX domain-containing protein [Flavobacteriaceae bacterium]